MISRAGKAWWGFLGLVLTLAIWLCASGPVWLYGLPLSLLEGLAQSRELLASQTPPTGLSLAALPGDIVAWTAGATVLLNLSAAIVLLLGGAWSWRNPISCVLALGTAFFAANSMWVVTSSPRQSLIHLALALALAALVRGAVPLLAGWVLVLGALSPEQGLMMYPALAYLAYRRQAAYGLLVPTLAVFGVGCLLVPIAGDYRLHPGLGGWHLLTLVPLAFCLLPGQIRAARGGIYAALLVGSALTETAELAGVLAVGDAAFVALGKVREPSGERVARGFQLSGSALLGVGATLLLFWTVLPGERYLNRQILIPAQKADVPLPRLFAFFSLEGHARSFAQEAWRKNAPFPELSAADYQLALELAEQPLGSEICPITPDGQAESRRVALVYALLSRHPLGGWDDAEHLAAPLLLCKLRGKSFLSKGPAVILRQAGLARLGERPSSVTPPAPLDFRSLMTLAHRVQQVSQQPGAAYRWSSSGQTYELSFVDQPAEVVFSARPGEYHISSVAGAARKFEVPPIAWELSGLPQSETLPSRSLVPLKLSLKNTGNGPISSDLIASWRIETTRGASFSHFRQPGPAQLILFPGETVQLALQLATPEPEGLYRVRAVAVTPEGKELAIPFAGPSTIRTWRRLPPVGTWLEEP